MRVQSYIGSVCTISHHEALAPYRKAFFNYPLTEAGIARVAAKEVEITALAAVIAGKEKRLSDLYSDFATATSVAAKAVSAPSVARAFLSNLGFVVGRRGDVVGLHVNLPVTGQKADDKGACLSLTTATAVACDWEPLFGKAVTVDALATQFSYDKDHGLISFEYSLNNPDGLGFESRIRVADSGAAFNEFTTAQLQPLRIRFELYPNRLLNSLDILTGKVLLLGPDAVKVAEGSVVLNEDIGSTH